MDPALVIRRELPGDEQPTRALHEAAFGVPEGADRCAEVEILDRLRADGDVLDSLTFVAELHGEVVGHVVCSRARMGEGSAVALGPIGVLPERQGEGIGSALVAAVIVTADHGGHDTTHGSSLPEDMTIPWIVSGPGIRPGGLTTQVHTMDTAATAAFALGLPLPAEWDGVPVYEAFGMPVERQSVPCK